jgi:hypothetical protein
MRTLPAGRAYSRRRRTALVVLCAAVAPLLPAFRTYVPHPEPPAITGRAFVITEDEVLASFSLDRVARALGAEGAGAWLDVVASSAERPAAAMPLNRLTASAAHDRTGPAAMMWAHVRPIAIVNRFDLAPANYSNCGEARFIYTRTNGSSTRLHIAVEAVLPNRHRDKGKAGCAAVAAFWWDLAQTESPDARRERLERFFFDDASLDAASFSRNGRIRTSEISDGRPRFAQFEMRHHCEPARPCRTRFARVPLDNMPDPALFDAGTPGDRGDAFRREFLRQVPSLAREDVNRMAMDLDRSYSVTDVDGLVPPFNYRLPFRRSLRGTAGREFREAIALELKKAGSGLTPEDIIDRAETQNCAGCHGKPGPVGGGAVFPQAFERGEHIAEQSRSAPRISPALREVFVPYRIEVLRAYLSATSFVSLSQEETQ